MKALIFILLLSSYIFGQDSILYQFKTIQEARALADSMISKSTIKHNFWSEKVHDKNGIFRVSYLVDGLSAEDIQYEKDYGCKRCITIDFEIIMIGSKPDLNIIGEKMYRFKLFTGTYLSMFGAWKAYFNKNAILEKTVESYSDIDTRAKTQNVDIRLQKSKDSWFIRTWYF